MSSTGLNISSIDSACVVSGFDCDGALRSKPWRSSSSFRLCSFFSSKTASNFAPPIRLAAIFACDSAVSMEANDSQSSLSPAAMAAANTSSGVSYDSTSAVDGSFSETPPLQPQRNMAASRKSARIGRHGMTKLLCGCELPPSNDGNLPR